MQMLFMGQVARDASQPWTKEDAFQGDLARGRLALSDGASESFDSRTWASLVTSHYVACPRIDREWARTVIAAYTSQVDLGVLTWSKRAAFERGSFATLLGVGYDATQDELDVVAIGDSLAVLVDGETFAQSFPYRRADEFSQRPELISTNDALNDFLDAPDLWDRHRMTWSLAGRRAPVLLCMTDALAHWCLTEAERGWPVWQTLVGLREPDALDRLVAHARASNRMRPDDVTLVTIAFAGRDTGDLSNP